jgi:hypothetical protein
MATLADGGAPSGVSISDSIITTALVAKADLVGGIVPETELAGYAKKANNGSDFADPGSVRANLNEPVLGSCQAVATANITLSGTQTIDGYAAVAGDRILATAQTTGSQNGPWLVASGAWTRPTDYASSAVVTGRTVQVRTGSASNIGLWTLLTSTSVTVDTTATTWSLAGRAAGDARYVIGLAGAAVITTSATPVGGKKNSYNASGGSLTPSLPALSGLSAGPTEYYVEKSIADTSANTITFVCAGADTFDYSPTATSLQLVEPSEWYVLVVVSISGTKYWSIKGMGAGRFLNDARYASGTLLATATGATGSGSLTSTSTNYVVGSSAVTIVLASQRRLRIAVNALIIPGSSTPGTYTVFPAYNSGGYNLAGAGQVGSWGAQGSTTNNQGITISKEDNILLSAGTYTFYPIIQRLSGGSTTDTANYGYVAVYDAGPS